MLKSFMGNIQVLIVDDYPEMRQLLRDMLHPHPGISVIGEAGTGEDAVAEARRLRPTVIIIDFQLPTMSGIEATRLIKLQTHQRPLSVSPQVFQVVLKRQCSTLEHAAVLDKGGLLHTLHPTIVEAVKGLNVRVPGEKLSECYRGPDFVPVQPGLPGT